MTTTDPRKYVGLIYTSSGCETPYNMALTDVCDTSQMFLPTAKQRLDKGGIAIILKHRKYSKQAVIQAIAELQKLLPKATP